MKKIYFLISFVWLTLTCYSQTVSTDTYFPTADKAVTITVNVEGTSLEGYTDKVWIWTWIDGENGAINAPTNVNPATSPGQDAALMSRSSANPNEYSITFIPTTFFNKAAAEIPRIGFKLKSKDWSEGKQSDKDLYIDFFQGGFAGKLISPTSTNHLMKIDEMLAISAVASEVADKIELFFDNISKSSVINNDQFNYNFTATEGKTIAAKIVMTKAGQPSVVLNFTITAVKPTVTQARPAGVKDGINYINDQTVILSLLAPGKEFVFVLGEFNNWQTNSSYQMKKTPDGKRFWLEINGLTPGKEYAFQYLVDGYIRIADPYSDKVLDPDDKYIPATTYPDLKAFPSALEQGEWYEKRASVLQTAQSTYSWTATDFQAPAKEDLMIYELLIRDFFAEDQRNYKNLIDTLTYFKKLGVNAIELMPITEFNGNDSWGYNPTFMMAPDKAYGTKDMLKKFIDEAHKMGIAVILDIVLNHQDIPNPFVLMFFDGSSPTNDNPWFNRVAKHPFNVFFDMNHESTYTQTYADTVCHYWLTEYKFDGLRFDLSKGFTQKDNLNNQSAWDAYDASRVAILKRISEKIFSYKPEAYVILEHFGSEQEEKELADAGMMLWGNMHWAYENAALGNGGDLSKTYYKNRDWKNNYNISYMESHDEERLMYTALEYGKASGNYNIQKLSTALDRMKLAGTFLYLVPGPKMLWQFGELGYEYSINTCRDGSVNDDCRVAAKPVKWDYLEQDERYKVNKVFAKLFELRGTEAFKSGEFEWSASEPQKRLSISHASMDMIAVGNFAVTSAKIKPNFSSTGYWYDYLSGDSINVQVVGNELTLAPGEFHIYTSKRLTLTDEGLVPFKSPLVLKVDNELGGAYKVYPNPNNGKFTIKSVNRNTSIKLTDISGRPVRYKLSPTEGGSAIELEGAPQGIYVLEIQNQGKSTRIKLIKE